MNNIKVEASVHVPYKNGYRVKVSMPEIGMYINGMMIYPPDEGHPEWSVLTPARLAGRGKYAHIVEFNKKLPLWDAVYDASVAAVRAHISSNDEQIREFDEMSSDDINRGIEEAAARYNQH
ncbi:hypothetical protein EON76_00205 [bacterium]|nr:MAG: hypothetical protein EON76_00205 [bacterium]